MVIKIAFSDKYLYPLPSGHRFPIEKYELVKQQLVYEGTASENQFVDPGLVEEELILAVHDSKYWHALKNLTLDSKIVRKIGLPLHAQSINRARNSVAGTVFSALQAIEKGIGLNLSGGTHHAYSTHGEGFCFLNDLAIAAKYLLNEKNIEQILIVDLDVHQGNGTAKIFEDEPQVFTFSMHGKNNYPLHKERSDLDVPLEAGTSDEEYLSILNDKLNYLLKTVNPDFVFFQAGVDVLIDDRLGKLALTKDGTKQRDMLVTSACHKNKIPLAITMGGGYAKNYQH